MTARQPALQSATPMAMRAVARQRDDGVPVMHLGRLFLVSLGVFAAVFVLALLFASDLVSLLLLPIEDALKSAGGLIFPNPRDAIFLYVVMAGLLAGWLATLVFLTFVWRRVAPNLAYYDPDRFRLWTVVAATLYLAGSAVVFWIMTEVARIGLSMMTSFAGTQQELQSAFPWFLMVFVMMHFFRLFAAMICVGATFLIPLLFIMPHHDKLLTDGAPETQAAERRLAGDGGREPARDE